LARHASATGLSSPETTRVVVTRTASRSGVAGCVVVVADDDFPRVVVVTLGAGLVGAIGVGSDVFEDDPLLHAPSTRAPTSNHERRTGVRLRLRRVRLAARPSAPLSSGVGSGCGLV
jgi:hypothetical protein